MKTLSTFILFISLAFTSWSQKYPHVDRVLKNYPTSFKNIGELANRINSDFNLDEEKVKALYNWMATNIQYTNKKNFNFDISNTRMVYFSNYGKKLQLKKRKLKYLEKILRTKKAICKDYSSLFKEVCGRIGIESEVVNGYGKISIHDIDNKKYIKNHSWNIVKIENEWKVIDVTWATVFADDIVSKDKFDYYFFTDPEQFILTHFPANPKWQLIKNKVSKVTFFKGPLFHTNYFFDEFKVSYFQKGTIKSDKRRLEIYFDSIPKNKRIVYTLEGNNRPRTMSFKKIKKGNFVSSIRYGKTANSSLTIYSNELPVMSFKIE